MKFSALILLCSLSIAHALPGSVSEKVTKLDGERQVSIEPGWLKGASLTAATAKVGGFWSDKSPTNFFLDINVQGVEQITGAKIGIDGAVTELKPDSSQPHFERPPNGTIVESSQRFLVPISFIEAMVKGKSVIVQVQLSRSVIEGEFSSDQPTRARPGFKKALQKIKGEKKPAEKAAGKSASPGLPSRRR